MKFLSKMYESLIDRVLRSSAKQYQSDEVIAGEDRPKKRVLEMQAKVDAEVRAGAKRNPQTLQSMLDGAPATDSMVGEPWSADEENKLIVAYHCGATLSDLVVMTGRHKGGVIARMVSLRLIEKIGLSLVDVRTKREVRQ